jgi:Tol biopolymer transport system component
MNDLLTTPSISPDGKRIVFNYNAGEGPDLYLVNSERQRVASPDKRSPVFCSLVASREDPCIRQYFRTRDGSHCHIAADGNGQKKTLTTKLWESVFPMYTPDGRHILFGSQRGGLVSAAWIMNADGSHQRRLTPAALKAQPWADSPDGKRIAGYFNQNSPPALKTGLITMNLDGSNRKLLASGGGFHHDLYPTYSPDGKKTCFASDRFSSDITEFTYGSFGVLTMNLNGGDIKEIVPATGFCPNDGDCVEPSWGASRTDWEIRADYVMCGRYYRTAGCTLPRSRKRRKK